MYDDEIAQGVSGETGVCSLVNWPFKVAQLFKPGKIYIGKMHCDILVRQYIADILKKKRKNKNNTDLLGSIGQHHMDNMEETKREQTG